MNTKEILKDRGNTYGEFLTLAGLSQALYNTLVQHYQQTHPNDQMIPPFMLEGLHMICHKMARIVNGNPMYKDSWQDISGYAEIVLDSLSKVEEELRKQQEEAIRSENPQDALTDEDVEQLAAEYQQFANNENFNAYAQAKLK